MIKNFEPSIGIENHIQLKTKTKIFSSGAVNYNANPNSAINPTDVGYPGTMPTVNKKCVELAIIACKILNLKINPILQFDRKNYYYPDLPKGFQITQQYYPIGKNGYLIIIDEKGKPYKIKIKRLHLEEDTAKQIYKKNKILLDYNRSGIGLIEIVTPPILKSSFQVRKYLEALREILIYSKVSNAKMNEGSFRSDINISLRQIGSTTFGNKVELKNLNSIANIEKAIEYEIKRQTKILLSNKIVKQETRIYNEKTKKTFLIRKKSNAIDYKYFPEPNIFPIKLDPLWIIHIIKNIPELPNIKRKRYLTKLKLKPHIIEILLQNYELINFFEIAIKLSKNYEKIAHYLIGSINSYLKKNNISLTKTALTPQNLIEMIKLIDENLISDKQSKIILQQILNKDYSPLKIISELKLKQINDPDKIKKIIKHVLNSNLIIIKKYERQPEKIIKFFMGKIINLTKGQIDPKISNKILIELITEKNY